MAPLSILKYAHELLAFFYAGALLAGHWNMLAVRRTTEWKERAVLLELNQRLSLFFSLIPLILLGIVGNLLAAQSGFRMSDTRALQISTALWLILVILGAAIDIPVAGRLAAMARSTSNGPGNDPVGWNGHLGRWRLGNALQLAVFLGILWIMISPWRA